MLIHAIHADLAQKVCVTISFRFYKKKAPLCDGTLHIFNANTDPF